MLNLSKSYYLLFLLFLLPIHVTCERYSLSSDTRGARFWNDFQFVQSNTIYGWNMAEYVLQNPAAALGLASLGQESPFALTLSVDNATINPPFRNSVKLQSTTKYGDGLYVLDINHLPSGCGVWPSFYTTTGIDSSRQEIDVIQNVNDLIQGPIASLHTDDQCQTISQPNLMTGTFGSQLNCKEVNQNVSGCVGYYAGLKKLPHPIKGGTSNLNPFKRRQNDLTDDPSSLGQSGSTVIVMERDLATSQTISIWAFDSSSVPSNLNRTLSVVGEGNGNPNISITLSTSNWPTSNILYSLPSFECQETWEQHFLVIDIALCGGWSNSTYNQSGCGIKYGTCINQVANEPSSFNNAFWSINSITIFAGNNYTPAPDPIMQTNNGIKVWENGRKVFIVLILISFKLLF